MADGSGRTLEQNIRFTNAAHRITAPHAIPLEGEVGSIDGSGLRRWNKTRADDLRHFVDSTDTDFVGVNIGQFHGFDYEFSTTRRRLVDIAAIDGPIALTACVDGETGGCQVDGRCPVRGRWTMVNDAVRATLERITLADMDTGSASPFAVPRAEINQVSEHFSV